MRWAGQVDFVGVAWFGNDAAFQGFIDKHGITFPTISDDPGEVFAHFDVPAQPALVVVSPDGSTQQVFGAVDEELLDSILTGVVEG